jgi:hypothetical protein
MYLNDSTQWEWPSVEPVPGPVVNELIDESWSDPTEEPYIAIWTP